jgi:hypothetical protein
MGQREQDLVTNRRLSEITLGVALMEIKTQPLMSMLKAMKRGSKTGRDGGLCLNFAK